MNLAIVTNILPPYRVPLFNYTAIQPDVHLRVFLCAKTEPDRHWNWPDNIQFDFEISQALKYKLPTGKLTYVTPGLIGRLKKFRPDVIIVGGAGIVALTIWIAAKLTGAAMILWSEATEISEARCGRLMLFLRRFLVHRACAFIGVSTTAALYFQKLGANKQNVFVSLQTLDAARFNQAVQQKRAEKERLKHALGFTGPVITYVGNLEPYKGPDLLLETYLKALRTIPEASLLLVGAGSLEKPLIEQAARQKDARVHFTGFQQHTELPAYYAITDLFCLFSRCEPFGVVVSEAVTAGLPVMCSEFAGAAHDLVEHGKNGFVINPEDIDKNVELLCQILIDDELRKQMAQQSLEIAKKCSIEVAGSSMLNAAHFALKGKKIHQ